MANYIGHTGDTGQTGNTGNNYYIRYIGNTGQTGNTGYIDNTYYMGKMGYTGNNVMYNYKNDPGVVFYKNHNPNFKNYVTKGPKISDFNLDDIAYLCSELIISLESYGQIKFMIKSNSHEDIKFKQICESLTDTPIHNQIKKILIDYGTNHSTLIEYAYPFLLDKIFSDDINDFTIKFSDNNSFDCNKLVLMTNKYFNNLLNDCDDLSNEMLMITDYDTTILLIKMLYKRSNIFNSIYTSEFCRTFELMDIMMMDDEYIMEMLKVLKNKLYPIVEFELKQNNFQTINLLVEHLKNISESSEYLDETKHSAEYLYDRIYSVNYGEKIFHFNNWQNLFPEKYKMDAIITSKKFELFNIANINFTSGIEFFKEYDFGNDCYNEIEHLGSSKLTFLYYKYNGISISRNDDVHNIIVLNEWFPIFNVDMFKRINIIMEKIEGKWITLKVDVFWPGEININSQILIGYDINTENIFTVKKIIKCLKEKTRIVNKAIYTDNLPIFYKIKINKDLPLKYNDMLFSNCKSNQPVWTLTQIRNKIEM